jgi:hypothetical protein
MAFATASAVARPIQSVFEITPVFGMRIETTGATLGTVTTQADIAIGMAGLTGDQRLAGLPGMTNRPRMEIRGDRALQMARITLSRINPSVNSIDIGVIKTETETAAMRRTTDITGPEPPIIMTVTAELGFMAT